jgi:hypothetical protein
MQGRRGATRVAQPKRIFQQVAERSLQLRFLALIGMLAVLALPVSAANKLTVAQVELILAHGSSRADEPMATAISDGEIPNIAGSDLLPAADEVVLSRLASVELTERMSTLTLYRLVGQYKLGPREQATLQQIADHSALLELPADERIPQPAPDQQTQAAMFNAARDYVAGRLSHLPDFVATRTTSTFDNASSPFKTLLSGTVSGGFRRLAVVQKQITFQDGREVLKASAEGKVGESADSSFESRGEFGTQAAVVLMDMEQGSVSFDHWENTMGGIAAVYRYSVPRASSHYEVTDRCEKHAAFHDVPGYHGTIALSPGSGAVLRLTLEADSDKEDPISHVASVVEYGPVVIGNHRLICPLRSLAFMVQEAHGCSEGNHKLQKPVSMLNQTIFSNYHRFGSTSTMIFDDSVTGDSSAQVSIEPPLSAPPSAEQKKPKTGIQPNQP